MNTGLISQVPWTDVCAIGALVLSAIAWRNSRKTQIREERVASAKQLAAFIEKLAEVQVATLESKMTFATIKAQRQKCNPDTATQMDNIATAFDVLLQSLSSKTEALAHNRSQRTEEDLLQDMGFLSAQIRLVVSQRVFIGQMEAECEKCPSRENQPLNACLIKDRKKMT